MTEHDVAPRDDEIVITTAAHRLRLSYAQTLRLVLVGELAGRQIGRRWYVNATSADRIAAARSAQPIAA